MEKKKLTDEEQAALDKKILAEQFRKTMEAKLRKSEKDIWYKHDHDHMFDN